MADVCNSHERAPRNAVNVTAEIEIAQAQVIASSPVPEATALIAARGASATSLRSGVRQTIPHCHRKRSVHFIIRIILIRSPCLPIKSFSESNWSLVNKNAVRNQERHWGSILLRRSTIVSYYYEPDKLIDSQKTADKNGFRRDDCGSIVPNEREHISKFINSPA
jgi:hypothetical protein